MIKNIANFIIFWDLPGIPDRDAIMHSTIAGAIPMK